MSDSNISISYDDIILYVLWHIGSKVGFIIIKTALFIAFSNFFILIIRNIYVIFILFIPLISFINSFLHFIHIFNIICCIICIYFILNFCLWCAFILYEKIRKIKISSHMSLTFDILKRLGKVRKLFQIHKGRGTWPYGNYSPLVHTGRSSSPTMDCLLLLFISVVHPQFHKKALKIIFWINQKLAHKSYYFDFIETNKSYIWLFYLQNNLLTWWVC